jgi:hypothetical protein
MPLAPSAMVVALLAFACADQPAGTLGARTTLQVAVPDAVAANATRRMRGDLTAPAPILIIEGLQADASEPLTLKVFGLPKDNVATTGPMYGSAALVGSLQSKPRQPLQVMDLPVPLNDAASELLASRRTPVTFVIQLSIAPDRQPLAFKRIYLSSGEK